MRIEELATNCEQATQSFFDAVAELSPEDLDVAPAGEWTPRQIIHHQAHSDAYCLTRIIQVVSEPGTQIRSFSEAAFVIPSTQQATRSRSGKPLRRVS